MDFSNRNIQPQHAAAPSAPNAATGAPGNNKKSKSDRGQWYRIASTILIAAIGILLIGLIAVVSFGGPKSEDSFVDTTKLQAVFLNTGQVYFGNIKSLNNKYYVLTNIYYLQTSNSGSSSSTSSTSNSVTLVKLGCELHEPYDQMVINSDQVTFWENLQSNGQVGKAVATFQKDNPTGQKCTDQSSSSSSTSNSVQSAGNSSSGTTPTKP
ncbi:MAG TPA: hypothetical protein VFC50_00360 [Candidatus Dormibacteraeota bacterium]|nr:hypothetical protein [Candidatus Dormibacteraeota bacterium]